MLAQRVPIPSSSESLQASKKARRLYLGNMPNNMGVTDKQICEFFNRACMGSGVATMPGEPCIDAWIAPEGKYGFVEFRSIDECTAGIALNGINMQGRQLLVKRPNDYEPAPSNNPTHISQTQGGMAPGQLAAAEIAPAQMGFAGLPVVTLAAAAHAEDTPTTALVLGNMVTIEELEDDGEYAEIKGDVQDECDKFGVVLRTHIPRPSRGAKPPGLGKVYVLFDSSEAAAKAKQVLHGRMFDNRSIEASYIAEEDFPRE